MSDFKKVLNYVLKGVPENEFKELEKAQRGFYYVKTFNLPEKIFLGSLYLLPPIFGYLVVTFFKELF